MIVSSRLTANQLSVVFCLLHHRWRNPRIVISMLFYVCLGCELSMLKRLGLDPCSGWSAELSALGLVVAPLRGMDD